MTHIYLNLAALCAGIALCYYVLVLTRRTAMLRKRAHNMRMQWCMERQRANVLAWRNDKLLAQHAAYLDAATALQGENERLELWLQGVEAERRNRRDVAAGLLVEHCLRNVRRKMMAEKGEAA